MDDIFRDMIDKFLIVYIDNILVFSRSETEHLDHVTLILACLWQHQLYAKGEKCEFHSKCVTFLGCTFKPEALSMDPDKPVLFPWDDSPTDIQALDQWFQQSSRTWEVTHVHLQGALRTQQMFANRHCNPHIILHPGQRVWVSTRKMKLGLPSKKLSPRYIGPFKVLQQINPISYELQLPSRYRMNPTFHVSLLKPVHYSPVSAAMTPINPPAPVEIDGEPAYAVRALLDSQRQNRTLQYLVNWEGYGPEEQSWVPRDDVLDPSLLADFHTAHPNHPGPRGRGRPRAPCSRASSAARQVAETWGVRTAQRQDRAAPRRLHGHPSPGTSTLPGPNLTGFAVRQLPLGSTIIRSHLAPFPLPTPSRQTLCPSSQQRRDPSQTTDLKLGPPALPSENWLAGVLYARKRNTLGGFFYAGDRNRLVNVRYAGDRVWLGVLQCSSYWRRVRMSSCCRQDVQRDLLKLRRPCEFLTETCSGACSSYTGPEGFSWRRAAGPASIPPALKPSSTYITVRAATVQAPLAGLGGRPHGWPGSNQNPANTEEAKASRDDAKTSRDDAETSRDDAPPQAHPRFTNSGRRNNPITTSWVGTVQTLGYCFRLGYVVGQTDVQRVPF
ncbi:hypothetical protein P4O66_013498 [Electrophorus voltai]|uniref:ribonuclease H n=1 Tax=Electrophorus voltai TaxID=2609070 RepID=A0AAD8Z4W0_9TELE|nr:hypothetical protein P4O66_013498 [Electrophorus voltai]